MRPGGAKAKGANGERELAILLTSMASVHGIKLELSRNLEQTRGGGHDLCGLEEYGMAVEVKRVEAKTLSKWWDQAVRQGKKAGCIPVLAWRQNRQPWRFRVQAWVWPAHKPMDVDLELDQFRVWFIDKLKERINGQD